MGGQKPGFFANTLLQLAETVKNPVSFVVMRNIISGRSQVISWAGRVYEISRFDCGSGRTSFLGNLTGFTDSPKGIKGGDLVRRDN